MMTDSTESDGELSDVQRKNKVIALESGEKKSEKWKKPFFFIILPIAILVGCIYLYSDIDLGVGDIISNEVYELFEHYDSNKDGSLSPGEFQVAYLEIQEGKANQLEIIMEREKQNYHANVSEILLKQVFSQHEEVLRLKTQFTPMDLNTMKKATDEDLFSDPTAQYHLHGLMTWLSPNIDEAHFPVQNFSCFLPPPSVDIVPGSTWHLIRTELAGIRENSQHLGSNRYTPPYPENDIESLLHYLLSMFHPRPFLHMRFPPRGAIASIHAVSDDYYTIMFRLHPEFQLNEPPRHPFWFTPASFIGELVIKKDASHIEYFKMHLPNHIKLNIDMEWITAQADVKKNKEQNGEVDIGYAEEMVVESLSPSSKIDEKAAGKYQMSIDWKEHLPKTVILKILEKEFYPFKKLSALNNPAKTACLRKIGFSRDFEKGSGRTLRDGPLESSPVTQLLMDKFISSWSLVVDLESLKKDRYSQIGQNAKTALENYKFPVQSMIYLPSGKFVCGLNANDLLDVSSESTILEDAFQDPLSARYTKFLQEGLSQAKML